MVRQWVNIADIDIYDDIHQLVHGKLMVDFRRDGKTTEQHLKEIQQIKPIIQSGKRIMPVLLTKQGNRYKKLDGFKRCMAYKELGREQIEAFVCVPGETMEYQGQTIVCKRGGQSYKRFKNLVEA